MGANGFFIRRAGIFPHLPTAIFERWRTLSYLFGTGFPRKRDGYERQPMPRVKVFGRKFHLPRNRPLRVVMGLAFVAMGFVGFLPVVGFWMIPVGLVILSVDSPLARRLRRRAEVWALRRYNRWRRRDAGSS